MAGIRLTGLSSGLDTEGLVKQLSEAYQMKVDNVKKDQTKLEWKKEAWSSLNKKLMDFYKGALSSFSSVSTYRAKTATGDLKGVNVTASGSAVNGTHRVKVLSTATSQMWTSKKLNTGTYTSTSFTPIKNGSIPLSELKDENGYAIGERLKNAEFKVSANGRDYDIKVQVGADATVEDVVQNMNSQLADSGLQVSFANGALQLSNESAIRSESMIPDGTTEVTYTGGHDIKITAKDEANAKLLGIQAGAGGTTLKAKTKEEDVNAKVAGSQKLYQQVETSDEKVTGSTKLVDLGIVEGVDIKVNGHSITVDKTMTLDKLAAQMSKLGIEANYDSGQGRFYLNSKGTGKANEFKIEADDATLAKLGLDLKPGDVGRIDASDAVIEYNGVQYEQASNTFNINGLTIEAKEAGDMQIFSVGTDAQGVYDKVKEFVKSYNELIDEMNKLYSAPRVKDYEPLTEDEKAAMSDEEVERWEGVIKGSLLRRDETISSLLTGMRSILNKQVTVSEADGTTKKYSLVSFGINTSTYTEKGKLHIYGDSEDADFADFDDALMKAINSNPEAVEETLSTIGKEMYGMLQKSMSKDRELSSALTFYNDKQIDKEINEYKDRVSSLQEKMLAEEDKYYKQFSQMEAAMAKLQAQQTYVSQLFGG